jgi:hypothetical protein
MKIYELIYYWDSIGDYVNITQTLLLTDKCKVNDKIKEFRDDNSNTEEVSNYEDSSNELDYVYFTYLYGNIISTLEVREHLIKV